MSAKSLLSGSQRMSISLMRECVRKLLRIWMTTEQIYTVADTDKQLHSRVQSRKHRYFGHMMRQPQDTIENSVMTGLWRGLEVMVDHKYAGLTTSRYGLAYRGPDCCTP